MKRLRWIAELDSRDFERNSRGIFRTFRRLSRLAIRGVGLFGLGALARNAANTLDALAKLADATGVAVEALQELRHVAELAGISQENFDTAILNFVRRLGELQTHSGPLFSFLKRYDRQLLVTLRRTTDTTTAFTLFAEAVRRAPNRQIQAALTRAGFGQVRRFVNLMRLGAPGLAVGRQAARDTLTIATEESARTAERLLDAQLRAQEKFQSQVLNVLIKIGAVVDGVITNINQYITDIRSRWSIGGLLQRGRDFLLN